MDETQTQQRSMLAGKLVSELQAIAEQVGVKDPKKRKKADLIDAILGTVHGSPESGGNGTVNGGEERQRGFGAPPAGESGNGAPAAGPVRSAPAALPAPAGEGRNGTAAAAPRPHTPWRPPVVPGIPVPPQPGLAPAPAPVAEGAPAPSAPTGGTESSRTESNGTESAAQSATASAAQAPAQAPSGESADAASASQAPTTDTPASPGEAAATSAPATGELASAEASSGAPSYAPSQGEGRPEYRRDRDGEGGRDRGRRRRRRDRNDRPERPGDRVERTPDRNFDRGQDRNFDRNYDRGADRNIDRGERTDTRPRREPEVEDTSDLEVRTGILDVLPEGYGFLRTSGYLPGPEDVYVSLSQVRRSQLRRGDHIVGAVRRPKEGEKYQALVRIDKVDGMAPEEVIGRKWFEKLTPLYPETRLHMELAENPAQIAQRIIDLVAPIGKGQRGMIVSPPKAGKTTIMKQIANSVTSNNPECHLIVLLVDERPEEVTDMQRSVNGEIVYSTFDRPSEDHIQVTELTLDRAKRLVELGNDVVILLDGITRLSRAYNLATPASGRILSGGVDSTALYPPKRFFGAARNIEEGGSLTIIATALVDTGSRMDEVIFEEFKGTGNWELRLDRRAAEKRIFPAIDIQGSGTRKEELLLSSDELALVWKLRRVLHALEGVAALELLVDKMRQTKGNMQFLREISKVTIGD
ncbi:MAG TPA: transcription termination factor Rho [Actinomycetota bacterium]|nr:transcription termination factor Rho [Actinomycetota bacterium]